MQNAKVYILKAAKMDGVQQAVAASGGAGAAYSSGKAMAIGAGIGGAVMAVVVMTLTPPKSHKESAVALISTLVFAVCGSSFLKIYFGIEFPNNLTGYLADGGLAFVCGAPGWVLVKAFFLTAEKLHGKDLGQIIKTIKGWFK